MTRPTLAREALQRWGFTLKPGQTYSLDDLVRRLTTLGYRREPLVQGRGEFSLRGGILDSFPPDRRRPLRSEFFGDELESLREFEVESQGSVGDIAVARTLPEVRDQWLADIERVRSGAYFDGIEGFQAYLDPSQPTLFDHLPKDAVILSLDGRRSLAQAEQREQELQELVTVEIERGELPQRLRAGLVSISSLRQAAGGWRRLEVSRGAELGSLDLGFEPVDAYAGRIDAFSDPGRSREPAGCARLPRSVAAARGLRRHRPLRWIAPACAPRCGARALGHLGA
jgi:transcription-repair coupling factor (superfamily II helicase)